MLKETFKKVLSVAALVVALTTAASADYVVKYGANVPKEHEALGLTKSLFVSNQGVIFGPLIRQYEIGGWFDNTGIEGRHSSALLGASMGINVEAEIFFAQALVGPAWISSVDSALGGPFQFNNDIAFGLRDPNTRATIGLNYKHVSSAGLELPNKGRDLIMFRVGVPW